MGGILLVPALFSAKEVTTPARTTGPNVKFGIALAKERGIRTFGLVRKAADVETVKQRGCDVVIVAGSGPSTSTASASRSSHDLSNG